MELFGIDLAGLLPFIAIGFAAQLVDGALGMAFGVITNTLLVGVMGVPPAQASQRVHVVECFTTAVSGLSHLLHRNIDARLFFRLLIPGVIGGVSGAYVLSNLDAEVVKPFVMLYLAGIGRSTPRPSRRAGAAAQRTRPARLRRCGTGWRSCGQWERSASGSARYSGRRSRRPGARNGCCGRTARNSRCGSSPGRRSFLPPGIVAINARLPHGDLGRAFGTGQLDQHRVGAAVVHQGRLGGAAVLLRELDRTGDHRLPILGRLIQRGGLAVC
ncbi:sulfite exporter TauE/SafE family protein [Leptolyngbya sp. 15MV]|nr:sulfite exporter TauE/SafE family protein [Leptolyngbya sp. 15MV]